MKDRITEFLLRENISPAEFADKIGVQRSSVSHVLNGRNYPGASFLQKMLSSYKNLNPRWLLLGEGIMIDSINSVKEPLLFPYPSSEEDYTKKKSPVKSIESTTNVEVSFPENRGGEVENKSLKSNTTELKPELNGIIDHVTDNKEIDRIMLFYKDKTFSVYTPSK